MDKEVKFKRSLHSRKHRYLSPIFLTRPSSTNSSMQVQVSWIGVFSGRWSQFSILQTRFVGLTEVDLFVITEPLWRVAMRRVDVLKGDREMNEVQVKVVDSPELKLFLCQDLDLRISFDEFDI
jgi:hypothetical protein